MPRYIVLNKPYGVLSQFTPDFPGQRTLAEFDLPEGVYAAGRLDKDSEGLLLLTDDKPLIHALLDPENGHERTYLVQVEGTPSQEAIDRLRSGVVLADFKTGPAEVLLLISDPGFPDRDPPVRYRKEIPTSWLQLTLTEGKNRQVRRMTAAVGYPTLRLIRTQIAYLELNKLEAGEWRTLSKEEERKLREDIFGTLVLKKPRLK